MENLFRGIEYAANLFDAVGAFVFFMLALGKNDRMKNKFLYGVISSSFIICLAYFQDISQNVLVQLSNMILIDFIFQILFLRGDIGTKLIYNMIYNVVIMLASMITTYGLLFIFDINMNELYMSGSFLRVLMLGLDKVILFMALYIIIRKLKGQEYHEWLITFLMFTGILYIGAILFNIARMGYLPKKIENRLILVAFGMLAICISIVVCIYKLNQQYHYKIENIALNTKLNEEKYMLEKINEMYEENRIIRHDLKHYLTILQGMLSNQQMKEAMDYLEEIIGKKFYSQRLYYTNNSIVNAVLNDKEGICKKYGIQYDVRVCGTILEQNQMEMGIILSNLIDNAIEAQIKQNKKWILVELVKYKEMFMIKVENYISESVLEKNPLLHTTKKDDMNHGIGIISVKKIVKKMEGIYTQEETEHTFVTKILLPDSTKCA